MSTGCPSRSDTKWAEHPQKMARGLKFLIEEEEGFCYLCRQNKGVDQLCGHRTADLRLCFRICKKQFSWCCSSNVTQILPEVSLLQEGPGLRGCFQQSTSRPSCLVDIKLRTAYCGSYPFFQFCKNPKIADICCLGSFSTV